MMKMNSIIRIATINDLNDIQDLNTQLFKKEYDEYDKTLNCEWTKGPEGTKYYTERIENDDGCVLVATENDKIIGYLAGGLAKTYAYRNMGIMAELENMFVLEEHRSKSIGSGLWEEFCKWCKNKNAEKVKVIASSGNVKGIKFYKKIGFHEQDLTLEMDLQ